MILHFFPTVLAATGMVTLKLVDDDRFLGASDGKLVLTDYKSALRLKLNPVEDASMKNLETSEGKALSEKRSLDWFRFKWGYELKKNKKSGSQSFRIVYYAPDEYLLMRYDRCLGFKERELTRVDCLADKVARFRICDSELCDNYKEMYRELKCLKRYLRNQIERGGFNRKRRRPSRYRNGRNRHGRYGRGNEEDSHYRHHSRYGEDGYGGGQSDSDDGYERMCGPDNSYSRSRRRGSRRRPYNDNSSYDSGYDTDRDSGYGSGYGPGYGPGYGSGYGPGYRKHSPHGMSTGRFNGMDPLIQLCQKMLDCRNGGGGLGAILSGNHLLANRGF